MHLVFGIYLGWITVATIANITSVLDYVGWDGFGLSDEAWLVIMLAVALVVAALMTWMRRDTAYLLVLVWAFAGIAVKFAGVAVVAASGMDGDGNRRVVGCSQPGLAQAATRIRAGGIAV